MALAHPTISPEQEEEWQELQLVLRSGILDRASNLRHFLEYIAEQHFAGTTEQIKEYSIAVQALHRQEQFDPQSDTIVRVSAHTLRKKLEQYYATEGADHLIQIRLPAGKYVLQFRRKEPMYVPPLDPGEILPVLDEPSEAITGSSRSTRMNLTYLGLAGAAILLVSLANSFMKHERAGVAARPESVVPASKFRNGSGAAELAGATQERAIRIRFGADSHSYVDVAGQTWRNDEYCKGGSTFSHPSHEIKGTDDPILFQEGREGKFQCRIPVSPGTYQLQLLFADTAGDKEAARQVDLSINNAATAALDIVDEAGGDDVVVGKVYAGIHPMSDGAIHLDFTSDGSFLNAIELTPSQSDAGLPLRMLAGPAVFHDDQGDVWVPERFFQGGRRTFHPDNLPKVANARLFEWERYGHFNYHIPVVADKTYKVSLYFSEGWFGKSNGGPGGIGSRVFDVYCNGTTLLKDFDIARDQKNGTVVMTFDHIKPTAHGMIELYFTPGMNYPLINSIEVAPET
jgi:Malectin domain